MATKKRTKDSNPDPITGEPGSHPVGVGVGTAGGASAGAAIGAVAGPIGAIAGAVVGGIAGGLAGKGVAEAIDPTVEDAYWSKNYKKREYVAKGEAYDTYRPAYQYGVEASTKYPGKSWDEVETKLARGWNKARGESELAWDRAKLAARDAYDRVIQLREEELHVDKKPVKTGEVKVRKEVVTERKRIDVPVEREEVVIERRPVNRKGAADLKAEEIRIPIKEEQVRVTKETVAKEEVRVGKRKVQGTQRVDGTVRKEQLRVEKDGKANVRGSATTARRVKT
jgi:uncharacterized protein (TIGR02271 family)